MDDTVFVHRNYLFKRITIRHTVVFIMSQWVANAGTGFFQAVSIDLGKKKVYSAQ
ncbi:hypothetical protein ES708_04758 [subsurface metagenome]